MTTKSLVTGAAGFIGSRVCTHLLGEGHDVVGVDGFTDSYDPGEKLARAAALTRESRFTLVSGHLAELPLDEVLDGVEVVYHLAGRAGVRASFALESRYRRDNVVSTALLLAASRREPSVRRLVYASSSSVYGNAPVPFREDGNTFPMSPYGWSKLDAERLCLAADGSDLETVALRYFTVYGPRQRPDMAFNRLIAMALRGEPFEVYGDGEQTRDFTFVADAVAGTVAASERGRPGAAYNLGGGSRRSMNSVLETLSSLLGRPVERVYRQPQRGDARDTAADISLARGDLEYEPSYEFHTGLESQLTWQQALVETAGRLS